MSISVSGGLISNFTTTYPLGDKHCMVFKNLEVPNGFEYCNDGKKSMYADIAIVCAVGDMEEKSKFIIFWRTSCIEAAFWYVQFDGAARSQASDCYYPTRLRLVHFADS